MANLVEFKLTDFEEIDTPIKQLENNIIRKLIMDLELSTRDKLFLAIKRLWQGDLSLQAKYKHKVEVEEYASHMQVQLAKMHSNEIISKLDPNMQAIIKMVIWRDGVLLCPEEAEIEDASKINIDWLIDMKELEIENEDNKSIAIDDVSITSFSNCSFFSITATRFSQEDDIMDYEY